MKLTTRRNALCCVALMLCWVPVRAERLPLRLYTTADGLASSVIVDIVADSRGFLWFATRDGLSRFDGSAFRTYTTEDGLPNPVVNTLLETRDGEYWVATNGGGVCRLNVEARRARGRLVSSLGEGAGNGESLFTCQNVGSHFLSNRVNVLFEDRQRRIWLGTDNGLFRIERSGAAWRVASVPIEAASDVNVIATRAIHEDQQGRLWLGLSHGLMRLDADGGADLYAIRGVAPHDIKTIVEHGGALWVGSSAGLLRLRPAPQGPASGRGRRTVLDPVRGCLHRDASGRPSWIDGDACLVVSRDGFTPGTVIALRLTPEGRLWIGTQRGLAYLEGAQFTTLPTPGPIRAAGLLTLADHGDGQLWIGSHAGAFKLTLDGLVTYDAEDGVGDPRVRRLFEQRDGAVFAISENWVINRFDGNRFHAMTPRVPADATFTYYSHGAFLDHTGQWWLLTDKGLYRLRPDANIERAARQPPEAIYTARTGLSHDRADRLFEDSRGDVWIATRSSAVAANLSQWQRATGQIRVFRDGFGADHQFPMAFAEDHAGAVWIGFESGGLARYHENRFRIFGTADGVPPSVMALHVDAGGALWIASASAGLSVLRDVAADRPRFQRYTTAQGLSSNNIQCLTDDSWGRIYAGTSRGIDRLDPVTGRIKHFGTSDGLASDYVTAALRDRSGSLWFGTNEGVSRLIPVSDQPAVAPPIWIEEVRAGGALQPMSELGTTEISDLRLAPGQNHLQVAFFGVVGAAGPLRYRYRLDGAGSDWTGPSDLRVVHYASLAPGRYRFVVEAVNADGVASAQPASVSFVVLPPLWQRGWFIGVAAVLLASVAFAGHRVRVTRILELERVRARIAADLHDDIGGTLSRIAIQSEVARRDLAETTGPSAHRLVEIGDTARAVVESLADVVWSVDPLQDTLASLERRLREYAADVLGPLGVRWTFHGAGHVGRLALGPGARRELLLLLKEGITNIARHAGARVASLQFRIVAGELRAELRDDGCGFDPAALDAPGGKGGRGLGNMRVRASSLGGRMAVNSVPGAGTCVDLVVPLRVRKRMYMRLWRARH